MSAYYAFRQIEAQPWRMAVSDKRKATAYEVSVDGVVIGTVHSRSVESWDKNKSGKVRTRFRGYSRTWVAIDTKGFDVTRWMWTRRGAAESLENAIRVGRS